MKNDKLKRTERGITLIALVITVIVLLILAGVALATLTGDSGILSNAEKAKEQTEKSNLREEAYIAKSEAYITYKQQGKNLTRTELVKAINEYFKGSTIKGNTVTTKNGKYDIIIDSNLNIRVEKHQEKEEVIAVNYVETEGNPGKIIDLEIELLGNLEYNEEQLKNKFLEEQFLMEKTTEELIVIIGKLATSGTEMTAEQVYDAMMKSELDGMSYADFMADKDAIIQEKYNVKTADLYAKSLILEMAEANIEMDAGTMIAYSKNVVPDLVGKDETVIKSTVEGYYNNEKTFDEIISEKLGASGVTLDILVAEIDVACYETELFSREEIMLIVAANAYTETHPIVVTYPDDSTENIVWFTSATTKKGYTAIEAGEYTFEVTDPKGNIEEITISSNGVGTLQKPEQAGQRFDTDEQITIAGKTVSMPAGFTLSGATGECELVENGIVIYLIPKGTTVDWTNRAKVLEAQKTYDQFVWVPVPKDDVIAVDMDKDGDLDTNDIDLMIAAERFPMAIQNGTNSDGTTKYRAVLYDFELSNAGTKVEVSDKSYTAESSYWEPGYLNNTTCADGNSTYNNVGITATSIQTEFDSMIAKVKTNGGFWVGRYETSNMVKGTAENTAANDLTNKVTVIKGTTTGIADTEYTDDGTGLNWYRMYAQQKNYATKTLGQNTTRTSSMIWGSQWDQIMIWMRKIANDKNTKTTNSYYIVNSVGMGNYGVNTDETYKQNQAIVKTGSSDKYRAKNIYDLAGNVYDWTLEANFTYHRVLRRRRLQRYKCKLH